MGSVISPWGRTPGRRGSLWRRRLRDPGDRPSRSPASGQLRGGARRRRRGLSRHEGVRRPRHGERAPHLETCSRLSELLVVPLDAPAAVEVEHLVDQSVRSPHRPSLEVTDQRHRLRVTAPGVGVGEAPGASSSVVGGPQVALGRRAWVGTALCWGRWPGVGTAAVGRPGVEPQDTPRRAPRRGTHRARRLRRRDAPDLVHREHVGVAARRRPRGSRSRLPACRRPRTRQLTWLVMQAWYAGASWWGLSPGAAGSL